MSRGSSRPHSHGRGDFGALNRRARRREWEQFRLLCRDSIRRLVNTALFTRDADPAPVVIWVGALVLAPPTLQAVNRLFDYGVLRTTQPDVHLRAVFDDRLFFLLYAMLSVALLTGLLWEALLPDRVDLEVVGPLPVRPRTLAAARFAAATLLAVGFTWATVLPSAALLAVVSAPDAAVLPAIGTFITHMATVTAACLFVFFALVACRAALLLVVGASWANRIASPLQVCTVAGLIEVVLYMPAIQRAMLPQSTSGAPVGLGWPPAWFAELYGAMARDSSRGLEAGGERAVWALFLVLGAAIGLSLLPAGVFARRALHATSRQGKANLAAPWHRLGRLVAPTPSVCAILRFSGVTLVRSSRHRLIVASYVGAAVAMSSVDAIAALVRGMLRTDEPSPALLTMPLALLHLGIVGTRAAFAAPLDMVATWPFRLVPPSTRSARDATRLSLALCVVLPVSGLCIAGAAAVGWPVSAVALVAALNLAAGLLLIEGLLVGWSIVPFTCARELSTETVQWRWVGFLLPLLVFVFVGARIQASALADARVAVAVLVSLTVGTVAVAAWSRRHAETARVAFEIEAGHSVQTLGLSEAER